MLLPKHQHRLFFDHVVPGAEDECWPWRGTVARTGYGIISFGAGRDQTSHTAHRISYSIHRGDVPAELLVRHMCHNRICVNPKHLELGTAKDNYADMVRAGRSSPTPPMKGLTGEAHPASHFTDAERAEAVRLFTDEKLTRFEVAEYIGCSTQTVSRWLRVAGVPKWRRSEQPESTPIATVRGRRKRGASHVAAKYTEEQRTEAVRLFTHEHLPVAAIARQVGCNVQTVFRWIGESQGIRWTRYARHKSA